jgi:hypothetical protein
MNTHEYPDFQTLKAQVRDGDRWQLMATDGN